MSHFIPRPLTEEERVLVEDAILGARLARPYYSRAFAALSPWSAPGLRTIAVDKNWRMYIDMEWFTSLPQSERVGVIAAHEIEHLVRNHRTSPGRDPHLWNIALDLEINDDHGDCSLPADGYFPKNCGLPEGETADFYYDTNFVQNLPKSNSCTCGGGSGAGRKLNGELSPEEAPGVNETEVPNLLNDIASDIKKHIETHGRGSVPAGVAIWADEVAKPLHIDWRRELAFVLGRAAAGLGRDDYSWSRPNRRMRPDAVLRPATIAYHPKIAIVVDTSCSMGDDGSAVLGTVDSIAKRYTTSVVQCEVGVGSVTKGKPRSYSGGGGTDMRPGIERAQKLGDITVVVTDGETPWPDVPPAKPVVIVLVNGVTATPAWARTIVVKDEQSK